MKELGQPMPQGVNKPITVMGKVFDPAKPAAYADSFALKRSSR
jgi:nitrate/nitrite transport system substrate-binding protein